jgi:hypothetical protein
MGLSAVEYLGWSATFVFVASYFCGRPSALRRTQMTGALMWVVYGSLMKAYPVVVANVLVFAAAALTGRRAATPSRSSPPVRST